MTITIERILLLTDVTLGFAVPQVTMLARSLAEWLGAETLIVEPDMKGRRDMAEIPGVQIRRIATRMPPHSRVFALEYVRALRPIYRDFNADLLIVLNAELLAPMLLDERRPKAVVYYMLESLDHQAKTAGPWAEQLNRMAAGFVDLVLVPERRRFAIDKQRLGWPDVPVVEVLNVSPDLPAARYERSGCRFLFAGTLSKASGIEFLLDERLRQLDIDVAGPLDTEDARAFVRNFTKPVAGGRRRYLGLIPHDRLMALLPGYTYRIVVWTEAELNSYLASPNKFFESIACGVPPICTPNPQILDIAGRYGCALVAEDFGVASFCHTMADAAWIAPTGTYSRLVANCEAARAAELNWNCQFAKVRAALERLVGPRATAPLQ